jgi:hypothetical protein
VKQIRAYLREVEKHFAAGRATEHTYRPALQKLVESIAKGVTATNEPRRIACGAPDFIITRDDIPLGYIEAKDIGTNLDAIEKSEQMRRYFDGLPNIILTDYLEFRLYNQGEFVGSARLARLDTDGKLRTNGVGGGQITELFRLFLDASFPLITTPTELAERMASAARILRGIIEGAFQQEGEPASPLHQQLDAFRQVLLHDLEAAQFADMYAQTICYGLFAACCNHKPGNGAFTRRAAVYDLPETNPFLRQMFGHIAGPELDTRLSWAVDHLAALLEHADLGSILKDFGRPTRREDPVVHFYETFLAAYDPALRQTRGVYYTPEPVVSYIVRSVDKILKRDFRIDDGLADTAKVPQYEQHLTKKKNEALRRRKNGELHKVLILDPAAGTGTFLHGVIDHIHEAVTKNQGAGVWDAYVSDHLLPRLFGFELLMAPYAVAHMKLGIQLAETGYTFRSGERLGVYLTNTLEEAFTLSGLPLFANLIAKEASEAGEIKTTRPVMVVLGNPPYSGHSANTGEWINNLMRGMDRSEGREEATANYFEVDGKPLGERNPKWLNDDYVKFIRFAQWRIEQTGHGVLAFISNHGYLDNPTFRGMRQSLMRTFDEVFLLDLHGNTKKKETGPDGSKDENVFDIQQGVAIGIFVRRPNGNGAGEYRNARVRHADLYGIREVWEKDGRCREKLTAGKYAWLYANDLDSTDWTEVKPDAPLYLFIPQDTKRKKEYEAGPSIQEIMPVNGVGMVTARDHMVIDFDDVPLKKRARVFRDSEDSDKALCEQLNIPMKKGWNIRNARKSIQEVQKPEKYIFDVLHRPFDRRRMF